MWISILKKKMNLYGPMFQHTIAPGARRSAQVIVPLVKSILQPTSVVDVGCGTGSWLAVWREHGVENILGIDGYYILASQLEIPTEHFLPWDLRQPICIDRKFDLAMCLEVAEHLEERYADILVTSLAQLAPAVLFSAAVPLQGGIHHVNEQWPDYWVTKFYKYRYIVTDPIRPVVWQDERVEFWYAQNVLLFISDDLLLERPHLRRLVEQTRLRQLALIHPRAPRGPDLQYITFSQIMRILPGVIRKAIVWRIRNLIY